MSDLFVDIEDTCPVCGEKFMTDGYVWTCAECRHPVILCECGSDDVTLDWTPFDFDGEVLPGTAWVVECAMCERTTGQYDDPKSALAEWNNGKAW
jgi:hypothetical protein